MTNEESIRDQFDRLLSRDDLSKRERAEAHIGRGVASARLGDDVPAIEDAAAAVSLAGRMDARKRLEVLLNAAGIYALAAEIAEKEQQNEALADERAKESIALLKQVIDAAPSVKKLIPQNRDLLPLRKRPDFQHLMGN